MEKKEVIREKKVLIDITTVFKNYYTYIYNYSLKLTCHPQEAQDMTQETFIKAWESLDTLKDENAMAKWLRTICFHLFLDKKRKEKGMELFEEMEVLESDGALLKEVVLLPEDEVIVAEEVKELQNGCFLAMVRRLSLNQRITFSLVDMFGLDIEYVAEVLGISKGAAKGLLYRARMNIDSFFADHCTILYEKNPCSCQAWIAFSSNRAEMQKRAKGLVNQLDYKEKNYTYREEVRKKLKYLYGNMPQQKPPEEWYQKVLKIINKN